MPEDVYQALKDEADREERTLSKTVGRILKAYVYASQVAVSPTQSALDGDVMP